MLLRFLALSFFVPFLIFGQDAGGGLSLENFGSLAGLVAGVVILTGLYKRFISDKSTLVVSIIISTLACAAGWYFHLGVFIGLEWWGALIYDVGIIIVVKGTVSIDTIAAILNALKLGPKQTL